MSDSSSRIYCFENCELDAARFELRVNGERRHVEPQVLSLLILLVECGDRMISKDQMIEKIWDGRIVSESAVAARVKAARKAIGDDGTRQRLIRTIHGRGFRFVGQISIKQSEPARTGSIPSVPECEPDAALPHDASRGGRPSIAVLPFQMLGESGPHDIIADALPADIIMDLSRLHWLFVIARGSSFRFRGADADPVVAGRRLNVRYCLTGTIERTGNEAVINVSLVEAGTGGVVWAEKYQGGLHEMQQLRPLVEAQIVSSVSVQIPRNEVRLARGRPASELDAWASFHLGFDHMYRFTHEDNVRAAELFTQALERDPYFSRALGGLSFTHFQNAFMRYGGDPKFEVDQAHALAAKALEADRLDPFAHFSFGRCFWLEGRLEESIEWFDRATSLSPSFAQGVYNRGLVATISGDARGADRDLALALELSPLDPLAYAMVSGRALTHIQLGDREKAAQFGDRAAMMPGAHKHIMLIAAFSAQLNAQHELARSWLAKARRIDPDLTARSFFQSFPYAPTNARELIEKSMRELGL